MIPGFAYRRRFAELSEQDVLALAAQPGNTHVGLYPELKHPTHFRYGHRAGETEPLGIDTAQLLVSALAQSNFVTRDSNKPAPLFIQCFEVQTLRRLRHQLPRRGRTP